MCGDSIVSITYGRTAQKKGKRYLVSFNVVDTRKKKRGKGKTHFFWVQERVIKATSIKGLLTTSTTTTTT